MVPLFDGTTLFRRKARASSPDMGSEGEAAGGPVGGCGSRSAVGGGGPRGDRATVELTEGLGGAAGGAVRGHGPAVERLEVRGRWESDGIGPSRAGHRTSQASPKRPAKYRRSIGRYQVSFFGLSAGGGRPRGSERSENGQGGVILLALAEQRSHSVGFVGLVEGVANCAKAIGQFVASMSNGAVHSGGGLSIGWRAFRGPSRLVTGFI
jgi:hypothetical protein